MAKKQRSLRNLAFLVLAVGVVFGAGPFFFGASATGAMLRPMVPLGATLTVIGVALWWWQARALETAFHELGPLAGELLAAHAKSALAVTASQHTAEPVGLQQSGTAKNGPPRRRPESWSTTVFEAIEWRRFEAVVEAMFVQAGFDIRSQPLGTASGLDIWLHSSGNLVNPVGIVRCDHWPGKRIEVASIRSLRQLMSAKGVSRGHFATTAIFDDEASTFAKNNGVTLLDSKALLWMIVRRSDEQQKALLTVALEGDYWIPSCVACGAKMAQRKPVEGRAGVWACTGAPACETTLSMRVTARAS